MAQGFDSTKPAYNDAVESEPVRLNLNAVATNHYGPTAPSDPGNGWTWIDTSDPLDQKLKAYLDGTWKIILQNIQAGPPSQSNVDKYVHTQAIANITWTITHTLNTTELVVMVWDASSQAMFPTTIEATDSSTVTLTFPVAQSGKAVLTG